MIRTTLIAAFLAAASVAQAAERPTATLYKDPSCGCCQGYAEHLRANGYTVVVKPTEDLTAVKKLYGVPERLQGCHSTVIGGYVVEGHVPLGILKRLLAERPKIRGIALPGMPQGSPGMSGIKEAPFKVYEIGGKGAKGTQGARGTQGAKGTKLYAVE